MNTRIILPAVVFLAVGALLLGYGQGNPLAAQTKADPVVYLLDVEGSINPALTDFIVKGIEKAEKAEAAAVVIRMDTPGGLISTTKTIIKTIINSKTPVVVYVAPSGSSASSAGALITVCADVAAMAPGTNIGAAHPVSGSGEAIDEKMSEKVLNDLTAYIRGIVTERGRNAKWAEKAIRESVSVTAKEALKLGAIDLTADSVPDLLDKINGMKIKKKGKTVTLETKGGIVERFKSGLKFKILDTVANPNIAYLLLMAGMLGLMIELYNPGLIFPGVMGGICLLLAFFALQVLPVNYVGVMLIILSVVLFILEIKVSSFGLLSIAAITCLTLGSVMLFETGETAMRVSWSVLVPTVAMISVFFIFAMGLAVKAWKRKPRTGEAGLVGEVGTAVTDVSDEGKVHVHGEYWNARADGLIPKGEKVRVIRVENLFVNVTRV